MTGGSRTQASGVAFAPIEKGSASQQHGPGHQICQVCHRLLPSQHLHVLDAERCAVFAPAQVCSTPPPPAAGTGSRGWLGQPTAERQSAGR